MMQQQKILIVDDKKANLVALRQVLSDVDAEIIGANDGNQVLASTLENDFALAILDVQMPDMDGIEATRQIRLMEDNQDLPVLAFTANVFKEDRQACLDAGMSDFVAKPIDPNELFCTLVKWLALRKKGLASI